MKYRTLLIILAVVLALGGVVYGAEKGWAGERAKVEESYVSLESVLESRVETAYNILTVAQRHLSETDETLTAVTAERDTLKGSASLSEKAAANAAFSVDAKALLSKLSALDDVKNDSRDLMYVENLLPQMLSESEEFTASSAYNTAAQDFNARFEKSFFSGTIARVLGVKKCEIFSAE